MQYKNIDIENSAQNDNKNSSFEVDLLKKMFQELLDTKRFEINDFLLKEDS